MSEPIVPPQSLRNDTHQQHMGLCSSCSSVLNSMVQSNQAQQTVVSSTVGGEMIDNEEWLQRDYDVKSVKEFVPPVKKGKVIKVYDGDTITAVFNIYGEVYKFQVRLTGIDTAEMKGSSGCAKKMAILARDKLAELILKNTIEVQNVSYDKYGRLLCEILCGGMKLNEWLINQHLALPYAGDTKQPVNVWDNIYETHWKTYWESHYDANGKKL